MVIIILNQTVDELHIKLSNTFNLHYRYFARLSVENVHLIALCWRLTCGPVYIYIYIYIYIYVTL